MPRGRIKIKDHYSFDDKRFPIDPDQINRAIKFCGLTQSQIQIKMGLSKGSHSINDWKRLASMPLKRNVIAFSKITGVRPETLVLTDPTSEQLKTLEKYRNREYQRNVNDGMNDESKEITLFPSEEPTNSEKLDGLITEFTNLEKQITDFTKEFKDFINTAEHSGEVRHAETMNELKKLGSNSQRKEEPYDA